MSLMMSLVDTETNEYPPNEELTQRLIEDEYLDGKMAVTMTPLRTNNQELSSSSPAGKKQSFSFSSPTTKPSSLQTPLNNTSETSLFSSLSLDSKSMPIQLWNMLEHSDIIFEDFTTSNDDSSYCALTRENQQQFESPKSKRFRSSSSYALCLTPTSSSKRLYTLKSPPPGSKGRGCHHPSCDTKSSTPKKSNTARSFSYRLLFGEEQQHHDTTSTATSRIMAARPCCEYDVDGPISKMISVPQRHKSTKSVASSMNLRRTERDSLSSCDFSRTSSSSENDHLQDTTVVARGFVGQLQIEASIPTSLAEIPFTFDDNHDDEAESVESVQDILTPLMEPRLIKTNEKQLRKSKKESKKSKKKDRSKRKKECTTTQTEGGDKSQPKIALTEVFSWSKEPSVPVSSTTTRKTPSGNEQIEHTMKNEDKLIAKVVEGIMSTLPPECNHIDFPPSIESCCSDSDNENEHPLQLLPALQRSIISELTPVREKTKKDSSPKMLWRRKNAPVGEC